MIGALTNHVWQSTVFALVAGVLTVAFRQNRAQVRYWLWFSASFKFLIPFALLIGLGGRLPAVPVINAAQKMTPVAVSSTFVQISQPFSEAPPVVPSLQTAPIRDWLGVAVFGLWLCGLIAIAALRWRGWQRIRAAVHASSALTIPGVEMPAGVQLRSTPGLVEPGVVGWRHPILLVPQGIADHLTPNQLEPVLAHELCHVRRRDNLTAGIHMVAEALFWFHPLVWWIGARLVDERERACDEEVVRLGSEPQMYANSILKVCEFYLQSPLTCVAGVTGSNLKKRIEMIMAHRITRPLDVGRKLLLGAVGLVAVAGPLALGIVNAPVVRAQSTLSTLSTLSAGQPATTAAFDVASVKPHKNPTNADLRFPQFLPGGRFISTGPLVAVIAAAYHVPFNAGPRLSGGPDWVRTIDGVYDIDARAEKSALPDGLAPSVRAERLRSMLQRLLEDRFKLVVRRETKELPIYAIVIAKGGSKLQKADVGESGCLTVSPSPNPSPMAPATCHVFTGGQGRGLHARAVDVGDLAAYVENWAGRPVIDKTGLDGLYRIETNAWQPLQVGLAAPDTGAKADNGSDLADLPTLFQVFEGLGLRLEPQTDKVDVFVIDHIERPSED